jgi:hypothetical protein
LLFIIFPENSPPGFPFKYFPLIFTDLFYFVYLTLFYKRAKSKDGFIQTKKSIMKKEKIYSVIKLADLILSKLAYFLIPIFILCICAIIIDFVYFFISMGYKRHLDCYLRIRIYLKAFLFPQVMTYILWKIKC